MSGWSTTNATAAYFRSAILLLCMAVIPYKYCYSIASQVDTPSQLIIKLQRNTFFNDCSMDKKTMVETNKDVAVYQDGQLQTLYTYEELCPDE